MMHALRPRFGADGRPRGGNHCPCRASRSDPPARPPPAFACGRWPPAAPNSGPRSLWRVPRCRQGSPSGRGRGRQADHRRRLLARRLPAMPLRASARRPKSGPGRVAFDREGRGGADPQASQEWKNRTRSKISTAVPDRPVLLPPGLTLESLPRKVPFGHSRSVQLL